MSSIYLDWESGYFHYIDSDEEEGKISRAEMLEPDRLGDYDFAVIEQAHLIPRISEQESLEGKGTPSAAQVFSEDELNNWQPGCTILEFNNMMMSKARDRSGFSKSKDAQAIRWWFENKGEGARKWVRPCDDTPRRDGWEFRNTIRDEISLRCNIARANSYETDDCARAEDAWKAVLSEDGSISQTDLDQLGIKATKSGLDIGPIGYIAYATVFDSDKKLRQQSDGQVVGVKFLVDEVIGLQARRYPNQMRATIVRRRLEKQTPPWHGNGSKAEARFETIKKRKPRDHEAIDLYRAETKLEMQANKRAFKHALRLLRDSAMA